MKKLSIFLLLVLISSFSSLSAQEWIPVGNGLSYGGYVNTMQVKGSILYVGGYFTSPGNNIAQWNDTSWTGMSSGVNNEVSAITVYADKTYVGGFFSQAGGHSAGCIAIWDGANFANAGFDIEGAGFNGGGISSIADYDGVLYIGGTFDSLNHRHLTSSGLLKWDGFKADSVDPYPFGNIYSLITYDNLLIIGQQGYGNSFILSWDNFSTSYFGNYFLSNDFVAPYSFCIAGNKLYTGGAFKYAGGHPANNIAEYSDTNWQNMGKGINGVVYALASYKNFVFAGGSFDSAGGMPANNIAMWDGNTWAPLGTGINGPVYSLAVFNGDLYAGGLFTSPGIGIAKLEGPLGINEVKNNSTVNIFPNPTTGVLNIVCHSEQSEESLQIIKVYNVLGEVILTQILHNTQGDNTIDISKEHAGIYIYKIFSLDGTNMGTGKLIKE